MNQTLQIDWHDHSGGEATVVACMDPRFAPENVDIPLLVSAMPELGKPDVIREAGASKNIIDPERRAGTLHSIALSVAKHGSKVIVVFDHYDCGDYGGTKKCGGGGESELKFHVTKLKKAREVVTSFLAERGFGGVAVKLAYLNEDTKVVVVD